MLPNFEPRGQGEMSSFSHFLTVTHLLSFSGFFLNLVFFHFPHVASQAVQGHRAVKPFAGEV